MASMTREQRDAFLRETRIAALTTLDADGAPVTTPVWYEWDGAHAWVFTTPDTAKVQRIRANPRVGLSVMTGVGEQEAWVSIEGEAAVDAGDAWPLIERLTPRYYAPEQAAKALPRWRPITWTLLRITPRKIRTLAPENATP